MFHNFAHFVVYPYLKILYRLKLEGAERIPRKGAVIVACNHASYLDPVVAGFCMYPRSPAYMAKKELFSIPLFNLLIKALGAFPVDQSKDADRSAIKKSIETLNKGRALIIFPQGTRSKSLKGQVYEGSSYLAYKTGAVVLPVAIIGTDVAMPEGAKLPRFPKITVRIGYPVTVEKGDKTALPDLTKETMGQIIEMMK